MRALLVVNTFATTTTPATPGGNRDAKGNYIDEWADPKWIAVAEAQRIKSASFAEYDPSEIPF